MKHLLLWLTFLLLPAICLPLNLRAQSDTLKTPALERVILRDGTEIVGHVERETETTLVVRTLSGVVSTIPKEEIRARGPIEGYVEGREVVRNDPNGTRLFFGPTARTLKAGRGYVSFYEVFFPALGIGITDWLDLSGGLSLFPGASQQLYYLGAKVAPIQLPTFSLAGGVVFLNVTGNPDDFDGAGIFHVIGTYGSQKAALTAGLGWGFSGKDISNSPVVILGGEIRISNSFKLISENWFPPHSDVQLTSLGVRFFGERLAADFALWYPLGANTDGFPFLPWIGFAYNFGGP